MRPPVLRAKRRIYYARIPGLNLASARSTTAPVGQTLFRNSYAHLPGAAAELWGAPALSFDRTVRPQRVCIGSRTSKPADLQRYGRIRPGRDAQCGRPRWRIPTPGPSHLTRFIDRNDNVFGNPWRTGLPAGNGIGEPDHRRELGQVALPRDHPWHRGRAGRNLQFEANYTLSFDKADDDNERDPFSFRYARADNLAPEYNWSDRDQRHRFNLWFLARLPGDFYVNNRVSAYSAQPTSEKCINNQPSGQRAASPQDRICADGTILLRNTIRRDNAFFSWDLRLSRPFQVGNRGQMELIVEVFNLLNHDNFKDPSAAGLYKNFDGTIRSGLGDPRQVQTGLRYLF